MRIKEKETTISEMINLVKPNKVQLKCNDYRACKAVDVPTLLKFYKGTDVLTDTVAKKYILDYEDDKTLVCVL